MADPCWGCQDGHHCRHTAFVADGMLMAPCRCPACIPHPVQTRLFGAALVEAELGNCVGCGQPATKLLVGGAGQPDVSLCERCEHRRYLQATGGRDYANEECRRWGEPPLPRPDLGDVPSSPDVEEVANP